MNMNHHTSRSQISRRRFLAGSAAVGAATIFSTRLRAIGANDDVRVAVIGINGRGQAHMDAFPKAPGTRVVALCDADLNVLETQSNNFEKKHNSKVQRYQDIRELLE